MVFTQLFDCRLLAAEVLRLQDILHPPLITGCRTQHTAHQMIMAVRMGKCVQGIIFIHAEVFRGNKDCAACPQRDVAHAVAYRTGTYCRRRIIPCARYNLYGLRQFEFLRELRFQCPNHFITLKYLRKLFFPYAADIHHLL